MMMPMPEPLVTAAAEWYENYIETPIRPAVKLLRDNGFNTICSCGHEMTIQCEYHADGEIARLHELLYNAGHREYAIDARLLVREGHVYGSVEVRFNPPVGG